VSDIHDLTESYLKVFLKDSRITEPSISFSPPAVSTSPTKQKVDRDMFLPATRLKMLAIQDALVLPVDPVNYEHEVCPQSTPRVS